jgi:hypothetical protein
MLPHRSSMTVCLYNVSYYASFRNIHLCSAWSLVHLKSGLKLGSLLPIVYLKLHTSHHVTISVALDCRLGNCVRNPRCDKWQCDESCDKPGFRWILFGRHSKQWNVSSFRCIRWHVKRTILLTWEPLAWLRGRESLMHSHLWESCASCHLKLWRRKAPPSSM